MSYGADGGAEKAAKTTGSGRLVQEMKRSEMDDKAVALERILFDADDHRTAEYLKDLVSAAGLRDAWGGMAKRMRHVQNEHTKLMAFASREALDKDYVTRPEYKAKVEGEYFYLFEAYRRRIETLENEVAGGVQERKALADKFTFLAAKLDKELKVIKPELAAAHSWLERLDHESKTQHQEVVDAIQMVDVEANKRDADMDKGMKALEGKLRLEMATREVLGMEVERQKTFLAGDTLKQHIVATCDESLKSYVNKTEMLEEVSRSTEFLVIPIRDKLESLDKELSGQTHRLAAKDAYIEQCLDGAEARLKRQDELLSERIEELNEELQTKAAQIFVDELKGVMNMRLQKLETVTTHKVQEVVARTTEFQVILSDHEHALQHQAEEILNRATKYEVAVHSEKIERCALKEKVDADFKDVKHTLSWTSTKLEAMAYDKSFGAGGGDVSRSASSRKPALSRAGSTSTLKSRSLSTRRSNTGEVGHLGGLLSKTLSQMSEGAASGDQEVKEEPVSPTSTPAAEVAEKFGSQLHPSDSLRKEGKAIVKDVASEKQDDEAAIAYNITVPRMDTDELEREGTDDEDEDEDDDGDGRGISLMDLYQSLQEQINKIQDEIDQDDFVSGTSSLLLLMHQQLECLAKAVMGLGRAVLRPATDRSKIHGAVPGLSALPRDARVEHSSDLIYHISSVLHWISHRKRPTEWDPDQLTTLALQAIPPPGSDLLTKSSTPQKQSISPKEARARRLARLRNHKAAASPLDDDIADGNGRASASGGGWRHRGFVARTHPSRDLSRPCSSADSVDAVLPIACGTRLSPRPGDGSLPSPPGQRANVKLSKLPATIQMVGVAAEPSASTASCEEEQSSLEMSSSLQFSSLLAGVDEDIVLPKLSTRASGSVEVHRPRVSSPRVPSP